MPYVAFSVLLGVIAVFQAAINRHIALRAGLALAALLNTSVATVIAAIVFVLARKTDPGFLYRPGVGLWQAGWFWLLPGTFGFLLVALLPWAVHHVGALRVFVGVVAAQMLTSIAWDHLSESMPLTATRGVGALLAVASVALVSWR